MARANADGLLGECSAIGGNPEKLRNGAMVVEFVLVAVLLAFVVLGP